MAIVFLGLGSNLGNKAQYLNAAKDAIKQEIGEIITQSSFYETKAVGFEGNSFINQVIKVQTTLSPENLLQKTQKIEKKLGRIKKSIIKNGVLVYANRTIDIDILLYDDLQMDTETLTIPHPRMHEREFVMKPLREIMGTYSKKSC